MDNEEQRAAYEAWRNSLPNGSLDVTPAQAWQAASTAQDAEIARLTAELALAEFVGDAIVSIVGERDAARAQLARASAALVVEQEPVAWLHDTEGRVDVIHSQVKQLWLKMGQPNGFYREKVPCRVEHYTIPLYAHPQPSADDARRTLLEVSKVGFEFAATLTDHNLVHEFNGKEYLSRSTVMKLAQDWREQHAAAMKGAK